MSGQRPARISALRERIAAAGIDTLLVSSLPNIRYLTGFSGSSALVLVTLKDIHLVTDFRYETQVADEVGDLARIRIESESLWTGLWGELGRIPALDIIGFESAYLPHREFQRLMTEGPRWQWRPQLGLVEGLRESKDSGEVALIEEAGRIATRALARALEVITVGLTEMQIAGTLEHALREEGSEDFPFSTIVASGPRSALPHARASNRLIQRGDLLLLDFGAQHQGYCSDITRTVTIGPASEEQRTIHEIVRTANSMASTGVHAGMTGQDADALARSYIEGRGFGEAFGHSLGHGLGLEVHEAPRLAKTAVAKLSEGAVVTIEPGIYRPGWGGVRIEDNVHLSPEGPRVLTDFTRELLEVG